MGITERNPGALAELTRKVRYIQSAGFRAELSQVLAACALKQVADGFLESRDPYGNAWAPLKLRNGKPLLDTGRLRASAAVAPSARGFRLTMTAKYAAAHQYGATIVPRNARVLAFPSRKGTIFAKRVVIPRRQMVPERETGGLGPIWTEAFNREADSLMRRRMGKAA